MLRQPSDSPLPSHSPFSFQLYEMPHLQEVYQKNNKYMK